MAGGQVGSISFASLHLAPTTIRNPRSGCTRSSGVRPAEPRWSRRCGAGWSSESASHRSPMLDAVFQARPLPGLGGDER